MTDHVNHELGPYALVPLWLLEALMETSSKALPLYVALHRWTSGADRTCYPSRKTLADYLGVGTSTIDRWSTDLQEIGALTVTRRYTADGDPTSNLYTLRVVKAPLPIDGETPLPIDAATPLPTDGSLTKPSLNQTQTNQSAANVTVEGRPSFEEFWSAYPRKKGKAAAAKTWNDMSDTERGEALAAIPAVRRSYATADERFTPYASTWLNQRRWEDEDMIEPERPVGVSHDGCELCDGTGFVYVDERHVTPCQTPENVEEPT